MNQDELNEWVRKNQPLILFSLYTDMQRRILKQFGQEIIEDLDAASQPNPNGTGRQIEGQKASRAHGLFWLWVLGAYEVVRTMCQAKACFSERLGKELTQLKNRLAVIRMPFAKQEVQGNIHAPGWRELSAVDFGGDPFNFEFLAVTVHGGSRSLTVPIPILAA